MPAQLDMNALKESLKTYAFNLQEESEKSEEQRDKLEALSRQVLEAFMLVDFAHKGIAVRSDHHIEGDYTRPTTIKAV